MLSQGSSLIMGVLYPGLEEFLPDYINSLKTQDDHDFDVLILNDAADGSLRELFPKEVKWIDIKDRLSFGAIRMVGVNYAMSNKYDFLIFSDLDDYFSENRVRLTKKVLARFDFAFTELQVINKNKSVLIDHYLKKTGINPYPKSIGEIIDRNYYGLSHTAVRTIALERLYIPNNIEVVDWWIFSIVLLQGYHGCFIPDSLTFYRQSDNNFVGIGNPLDDERLGRGINVKMAHYGNLILFCERYGMVDHLTIFNRKFQEMRELQDKIRNKTFMQYYISIVNRNIDSIYRGWWSEILSLQELSKYDK